MHNQPADTLDDNNNRIELKAGLEDARNLADKLGLPLVAVFIEQAIQNLDRPKRRK